MKKSELKKILTPLIRACIREVILEENGIISNIVSEVASGLSTAAPTAQIVSEEQQRQEERSGPPESFKNLSSERRAVLDAIGNSSYGTAEEIFEGTTPAVPESKGMARSPLSGQDPRDPGVDISSLKMAGGAVWKQLAGMEKKGR